MDKILSGSQLIIEGDSSVQSCVGEFISGGQGWTQNGPIDIINNKLIVDFPVGSSIPVKLAVMVSARLPHSNFYNTTSYFDITLNGRLLYNDVSLGITGDR